MAESAPAAAAPRAQDDPALVRWSLTALALAVMAVLVVVPVVNVFYEALSNGPRAYWEAITGDEDTRSAILLTLKVAPAAVLANLIFGLAAAWAIARFRFPGRTLMTAMIDLPFAVSPVVAGLILVLIFGRHGYLGAWLQEHGIQIIFNTPGLILATAFVTFPFVARELIPLMEAIGSEEEVAAVSLGARAWTLFRRITLPNVKWGILYGLILCNARAMGEFGAVYVVSGHIAGQTDTMSLRVEKLFQEYDLPGSFALASLLCFLALVTLAIKTTLEWQTRTEIESRKRENASDAAAARPSSATRLHLVRPKPARPADTPVPAEEEKARVGISIRNVTKRFGSFVALDGIDLEVPEGGLLALLGPSGSGKTTLLRIIAGLEQPDDGAILYREEDATYRSARDRNVGFVFQHYALFRHMSVFENVAFGLRVRKWPEDRIRARVDELLRLIQLEGLGKQAPAQLSGGQRQRVALARALAAQPKVLLLDEPFGALDAKVRQELRQWLRKLHDEIHVTSVFVTHDQEEAFEVADQVVVMNRGRIEQVGAPQDVFEHPANDFVMDFLGNVNVFHGRVEGGRAVLGTFAVEHDGTEGQAVKAYVRPHELDVDRIPRGTSSLKAEILRINPVGSAVKIELLAPDFGVPLNLEVSHERHAKLRLQPGDTVFVFPRRVRVFAQDYQI